MILRTLFFIILSFFKYDVEMIVFTTQSSICIDQERREKSKKILNKNEIRKQTTDNLTNGQLEIFYKLDIIQIIKIFYKFCLHIL